MIDLVNFIKEDDTLGIQTGISNTELLNIKGNTLGEKHLYDQQESEGYSYFLDGLEIMIVDDAVYCLSINPSKTDITFQNKTKVNQHISLDTFVRLLDVYDIDWSFYQNECFDKQINILTANKVMISFTFDNFETKLNKIQKYSKDYVSHLSQNGK